MTLYKWSQTASADAAADSTINWAEGQSPSSVNDSARAMMAATAKYRDDIAGAIVTGGTSTAYTVLSYQVFDTLAHLNGQMIAFTPHTTNGATVTLNVDGLGNKPLRASPNVELLSGTIIQGTPYVAVYNNSDGAFYLQGFFGNPYNVPLLGGMDFWDTVAPNSAFIFPFGQAISRTAYAAAFARWGITFGAGDGSTTFNVPDKRGRVAAAADNMGGVAAGRLTGFSSEGIGGSFSQVGGVEKHTLTTGEMPVHSHGVTDPGHTHSVAASGFIGSVGGATQGGSQSTPVNAETAAAITINSAVTGISIQNAGNGGAHNILQPTICCNYIIRII